MPDGANKGSSLQGYSAQVAVDFTAQVIVAAEITQEANGNRQLVPMLLQTYDKPSLKSPVSAGAFSGLHSRM